MKEIRESDGFTTADLIGMGDPHMRKRGECFIPTGSAVHDFDEDTATSTFQHKGKWVGVYGLGGLGTCIRDYDMIRINPPKVHGLKSEPTVNLMLHTPFEEKLEDFCAVITVNGKMLAHKKTGTLYRLSGECIGSSYLWIKHTKQ